jgi:hypothetical protein
VSNDTCILNLYHIIIGVPKQSMASVVHDVVSTIRSPESSMANSVSGLRS